MSIVRKGIVVTGEYSSWEIVVADTVMATLAGIIFI